MRLISEICYSGCTEQAIELYKEAFDVRIQSLIHYEDAVSNGWETPDEANAKKVYHAEILFGNQEVRMNDLSDMRDISISQKTHYNAQFDTEEEVEKAFNVLAKEGEVIKELTKPPYMVVIGEVKDKFGIHWVLMCDFKVSLDEGSMNVSEFRPNMPKVQFAYMPNAMLVGRAKRNSQLTYGAPGLWREMSQTGDFEKIATLPRLISNTLIGWSGDCPESENDLNRDFTYMVGALVPMGTPIPDGLDFRVLRETLVVKSTLGMDMYECINKAKELGYITNYGDNNGWNAELYIDGEPDEDKWSWMIPVKK